MTLTVRMLLLVFVVMILGGCSGSCGELRTPRPVNDDDTNQGDLIQEPEDDDLGVGNALEQEGDE